jgi:hypothetical protein
VQKKLNKKEKNIMENTIDREQYLKRKANQVRLVFWADKKTTTPCYYLDTYFEDINPDNNDFGVHFESESLDEIEKFLDT